MQTCGNLAFLFWTLLNFLLSRASYLQAKDMQLYRPHAVVFFNEFESTLQNIGSAENRKTKIGEAGIQFI